MRSPGEDQAKRPRELGLGGLDLSFRPREGEEDVDEVEMVGKEEEEEERTREEEEEEEEGGRRRVVATEEEGRETESDDGTPRPNGGTT